MLVIEWIDSVCSTDCQARKTTASTTAKTSAPAAPPLPPLVETSTIVRCVSRAANTRASSISAAVPDSSPSDPRAAASRWARITIGVFPLDPGRCAVTVSSVLSPPIVCASK